MPTPKTQTLQYQEQAYTLSTVWPTSQTVTLTLNETPSTWRVLQQQAQRITLHNLETGKIITGSVLQTPEGFLVHTQGWVIGFQKPLPSGMQRGSAREKQGILGPILAPMPGTVLKLLVAQGDEVAANTPLVILESMKMELTISAPDAGWVSAINVSVGEMVAMQAPLLTLSALENAPDLTENTP